MSSDNTFSRNYVELCASRNEHPTIVAEKLGYSRASGGKWANGSTPRPATRAKIAAYFGVPIESLLKKPKAPAAQGDGRSMEAQEKYDLLSPEDQKIVMDLMESLVRKQRGGQA